MRRKIKKQKFETQIIIETINKETGEVVGTEKHNTNKSFNETVNYIKGLDDGEDDTEGGAGGDIKVKPKNPFSVVYTKLFEKLIQNYQRIGGILK